MKSIKTTQSIALLVVALMPWPTVARDATPSAPECMGAAMVPDVRSAIRRAGESELEFIKTNATPGGLAYAIQALGSEEQWQQTWTATLSLRSDVPEGAPWRMARYLDLADDPGLQGGIWRVEMFARPAFGRVAHIARCSGRALVTSLVN